MLEKSFINIDNINEDLCRYCRINSHAIKCMLECIATENFKNIIFAMLLNFFSDLNKLHGNMQNFELNLS